MAAPGGRLRSEPGASGTPNYGTKPSGPGKTNYSNGAGKRPYSGSMSTLANVVPNPGFTTVAPQGTIKVPMTKGEQQAFSGSGYTPSSPPGKPGTGIKPQGVKKGLPSK